MGQLVKMIGESALALRIVVLNRSSAPFLVHLLKNQYHCELYKWDINWQ